VRDRIRVLLLSRAALVGSYRPKLVEIARLGVDLTVVVPPSWRERGRVQHLEPARTDGYTLVVEPVVANGSFHLHWYPRLRRRMAAVRPHVVHVEEEPWNLATWHAVRLARRVGARVVCFTWQNVYRRYPWPFRAMQADVLRSTDHFLAGSDGAREVLRAKGCGRPITVVPQTGIDPDDFRPADDHRTSRRPFTVGYAGRLVPEKGVDLLVRAVAALPGDAVLEIVGAGPEHDALLGLARDCGLGARVAIRPWLASADMPQWYRSIDVLVLPSRTRPNWTEQFGRVLVEAMASGVPVIGSATGEIPDVIADGGLIVEEDDLDGMKEALLRLARDPELRRALGDRGRRRVLDHYTHARIAAETVAVYRSVATGDPSSAGGSR